MTPLTRSGDLRHSLTLRAGPQLPARPAAKPVEQTATRCRAMVATTIRNARHRLGECHGASERNAGTAMTQASSSGGLQYILRFLSFLSASADCRAVADADSKDKKTAIRQQNIPHSAIHKTCESCMHLPKAGSSVLGASANLGNSALVPTNAPVWPRRVTLRAVGHPKVRTIGLGRRSNSLDSAVLTFSGEDSLASNKAGACLP